MISTAAMRTGFSGGLVVDFPNSSKAKKYFLCLVCGPPSVSTTLPKAKGDDGGSESGGEDDSEDEEDGTVEMFERHRPAKRVKHGKKIKGKVWLLKKQEQRRNRGVVNVPKIPSIQGENTILKVHVVLKALTSVCPIGAIVIS